MSLTYTPSLRLTQQEIGSNENTWGNVLNEQVIGLIDTAISGRQTINVTTGSNITLTTNNGSADQSRAMTLFLTGTPSSNIDILLPTVSKVYVVELDISGSNTVTLRTPGNTGVTFRSNPVASAHIIVCNGVETYEISEPQGKISMWSGTIATIPGGHVLCNGANGTPDLRDRFIVGSRQDQSNQSMTDITGELTKTGGAATGTTGEGGDHNHSGNTGGHALTVNQLPAHRHFQNVDSELTGSGAVALSSTNSPIKRYGNVGDVGYALAGDPSNPEPTLGRTSSVGSNATHSHTISMSGTHTHPIPSLLPPYYALAYIMRV